jgi:hypothetical protein
VEVTPQDTFLIHADAQFQGSQVSHHFMAVATQGSAQQTDYAALRRLYTGVAHVEATLHPPGLEWTGEA